MAGQSLPAGQPEWAEVWVMQVRQVHVTVVAGLWRGYRLGQQASVPDDALTAAGLAAGHCQLAEPPAAEPAEPHKRRSARRAGHATEPG